MQLQHCFSPAESKVLQSITSCSALQPDSSFVFSLFIGHS